MLDEADVDEVAETLYRATALMVRRLRQLHAPQELTWPERTILARLDREGPSSVAALEQAERNYTAPIGATMGALAARKLVHDQPDAHTSGRPVWSLTASGLGMLRYDRAGRIALISRVLTDHLSAPELRTLSRALPTFELLSSEL
ncbi:hypothetical protein [Mycobacterium kyorinense]|uniref:MarR family transcriptional regulator n=1 Tax=Mycobacterium kyorinense TaxID=487514 RepID=A0A1X1YAS5_9MYCO|nr:hypothetical protein [Mycobacterium kyorinense]ORW08166.1 hypothetical protein AWC14_01280 [Mycobacterium kyorinense]